MTLTETAKRENLVQTQQRRAESKAALKLPEQQSLVTSQHQVVEQLSHVMSSIGEFPLDIKRSTEQTAKASSMPKSR